MNDNKEIAVVNSEKSALVAMEFNEQQVDLIKRTVAKGTTNDELALFLYTCRKTGLDPLIKQIYAVKRNSKNGAVMAIQTGIDGYRLIAERTGKYAPGKEPTFKYDKDGKLFSATAYVNKFVGGTWHEVAATAINSEYVNATNPIWIKMPHAMLSKCAESLVLRKAFPAEMSGVMTNEEMEQAGPVVAHAEVVNTPKNTHKQPVEAVDVTPVDDIAKEQQEKEKQELAAKVAEAKAKLANAGIEATKVTPVETPKEASKVITDGLQVVRGEIVNIYPPKNPKGPTSVKVLGCNEYFKTFDAKLVTLLQDLKSQGVEVRMQYLTEEKNGYVNHFVKLIDKMERPMPSPMEEEAPW